MKNARNKIFTLLSVFALSLIGLTVFAGCDKSDESGSGGGKSGSKIGLNHEKVTVLVGNTVRLEADTDGDVTWATSDSSVATVSAAGLVRGVGKGNAVVTATTGKKSAECAVLVCSSGLWDPTPAINAALTADIIYSSGVLLYANSRVLQCIDVVSNGDIYYCQLNAGGDAINISCGSPYESTTTKAKNMFLYYFGHGAQMAVEEADDGKNYIWTSSNSTINSSGEYWYGESFCRVEWAPGETYDDGYAGETFFLNRTDAQNQAVALDLVNRRMVVGSDKSSKYSFWFYDFDEVMALPLKSKTFTVTIGTYGGETTTRTIEGRDLSDATLLGSFTISKGSNYETDPISYSLQGYEVWNDWLYVYEGNGLDSSTNGEYDSYAYITVYNKDGSIAVPRTQVMAVSDKNGLDRYGVSTNGYAEAEGIKIHDGKLYLGLGCRNKEDSYRRPAVLVYDLVQND